MNFDELNYIVNEQPCIQKSRIGSTASFVDSGQAHPLWMCLINQETIPTTWRSLSGAERGQIVRAAERLHDLNIPYHFYVDFLKRMGKLSLVSHALMMVIKYKPQRTGATSVLGEYLDMMKYFITIFKRDPEIIKVNDAVYKALPGSYRHGTLKYVHTVITIQDAMDTHTPQEVLQILTNCDDIRDFWNALGKSTIDNMDRGDIDLSAGKSAEVQIKILQKEIRIRLGKDNGDSSKALNKYFTKTNRLNVRGLKVISGERQI